MYIRIYVHVVHVGNRPWKQLHVVTAGSAMPDLWTKNQFAARLLHLGKFWKHFCIGTRVREVHFWVVQSDWSKIEKVDVMKSVKILSDHLVLPRNLISIPIFLFNSEVRMFLFAILARQIDFAFVRRSTKRLTKWNERSSWAVHVPCRSATTTRVWKDLTSSANPLWGVLSWKMQLSWSEKQQFKS